MAAEDDRNRKAAIEKMRERHQMYAAVFGTEQGALVLADLERYARYAKTARYAPRIGKNVGPLDPYGTIYNLALQEFVKRIHQAIEWSEDHGYSSIDSDGE